MLPIIDGHTKTCLAVKTDSGKKKFSMSYSLHLDTGDIARKAGKKLQDTAMQGCNSAYRYLRGKYREMKVEKMLHKMQKSLTRKLKDNLPINLKALRSRVREVVHA
jgi:hypothetical protein